MYTQDQTPGVIQAREVREGRALELVRYLSPDWAGNSYAVRSSDHVEGTENTFRVDTETSYADRADAITHYDAAAAILTRVYAPAPNGEGVDSYPNGCNDVHAR